MTCLVEMMAPPQTGELRQLWNRWSPTAHGNSFVRAISPPTILAILGLELAIPHSHLKIGLITRLDCPWDFGMNQDIVKNSKKHSNFSIIAFAKMSFDWKLASDFCVNERRALNQSFSLRLIYEVA